MHGAHGPGDRVGQLTDPVLGEGLPHERVGELVESPGVRLDTPERDGERLDATLVPRTGDRDPEFWEVVGGPHPELTVPAAERPALRRKMHGDEQLARRILRRWIPSPFSS